MRCGAAHNLDRETVENAGGEVGSSEATAFPTILTGNLPELLVERLGEWELLGCPLSWPGNRKSC